MKVTELKITPERKLKLLKKYMSEWINKYPAPPHFTFSWYVRRYKNLAKRDLLVNGAATGGVCSYCGAKYTTLRGETSDHVVPRRYGGINKIKCCLHCNQWKADKSLKAWGEEINLIYNLTKVGSVRLHYYSLKRLGAILFNVRKMLRSEQKDERSVATADASSNQS